MEHSDNPYVMYTYTRKQAVEAGVLGDITDIAENYGFVIPVAITATLFDSYGRPTPELEEYGQSLEARLAYVLTVLFFIIKTRALPPASLLSLTSQGYRVAENSWNNHGYWPRDKGEPVLTTMLSEDD